MVETGDNLKLDAGKPRFDLIPADPLIELASLFGLGGVKYGDRCWEEGMSWGRVFGAMCRHTWKWWRGETHDEIDGQHHLIAVIWCAMVLFEYQRKQIGEDDRV